MDLFRKAAKGIDNINRFFVWVCYGLIIFLTLIISYDVVMRQIVGKPLVWSTELCEYGLLWITFLGAAWLLQEEGHINIDLVVHKLNSKLSNTVSAVMSAIGAVICIIIAVYGIIVSIDFFQRGVPSIEMLEIPRYIILAVIPVGSLMLVIQFARRTITFLK